MLIENSRVYAVIGAAIEVHRTIGPGLLKSAYEEALAHEFEERSIPYRRQVAVPLTYKAARLSCAYRLDFVAYEIAVELKCVTVFMPAHEKQIVSYMRLLNLSEGLLLNFKANRMVDGVRRFLI